MTDPQQAIRQARDLIEEFALCDPTLWPILSEVDLVLSRATTHERGARPSQQNTVSILTSHDTPETPIGYNCQIGGLTA